MSTKNEKWYVKNVHLENYKSISSCDIDFRDGLNIIIGKNGSGKTNFMNFLYNSLNNKDGIIPNSLSKVIFKNKKDIVEITQQKILIKSKFPFRKNERYYIEILKNSEKLETKSKSIDSVVKDMSYKFVKHGIPYGQLSFFEKPVDFSYKNGKLETEINYLGETFCVFVYKLFIQFNFSSKLRSLKSIKSRLFDLLNEKIRELLQKTLAQFTPIKDIRVNETINVYKIDKEVNNFAVQNVVVEYFVNDMWIPFDYLSDGTKRLLYIISETVISFENSKEIILVEEPELGIHPHQLFDLMTFLKEESRNKQIIISTHSPDVLDFIDADELDRIIICYYDEKKKTQLRHLTAKEKKNAANYMQGLELSDYWKHSDLEPRD